MPCSEVPEGLPHVSYYTHEGHRNPTKIETHVGCLLEKGQAADLRFKCAHTLLGMSVVISFTESPRIARYS